MTIKKNERNLWATYENYEPHSSVSHSPTNEKSGDSVLKEIHGSKRNFYENFFSMGCGPKGMHYRLFRAESELIGNISRDKTLSKIPAMCQLRGLNESFRKKGFGGIVSNLDLIEWASPRMHLSKEKLDMRCINNPFEILVLSKPLARTVLVDVKDFKKNASHVNRKMKQQEVTVHAFITGTPKMVDFAQKMHESGIEIVTLLYGTCLLNSLGWLVSILVTHSCLFTPEKGFYKVCLPMIHLVTFTEADLDRI